MIFFKKCENLTGPCGLSRNGLLVLPAQVGRSPSPLREGAGGLGLRIPMGNKIKKDFIRISLIFRTDWIKEYIRSILKIKNICIMY